MGDVTMLQRLLAKARGDSFTRYELWQYTLAGYLVGASIRAKCSGLKYTDTQPRDESGRWSSGGSELLDVEVSDASIGPVSRVYAAYNDRAAVEEAFGGHEQRYAKKLTPDEQQALSDYTFDGSDINEALRTGAITAAQQGQIDTLDAALNKSSFPKAAKVTRYVVVEKDADLAGLQGKTMRDKGYLSTSLEKRSYEPLVEDYVSNIGGPADYAVVRLTVNVNKGAKAALLGGISEVYSDSEVLLPRGAQLKVRRVGDVSNNDLKVGGMRTISIEADYD